MTTAPALECVLLTPQLVAATLDALTAAAEEPTGQFFRPHAFTHDCLHSLATRPGQDLYYVLTASGHVRGYGLLRGWNQGYEIPSLGIMIAREARGQGLGRLLMTFLHASALTRSASRVRLRVHAENHRAIALYRSMNYEFSSEPDAEGLLVGVKDVTKGIA
jgi:[ribosomal protein S18]-alanine N-acetyltransferase